MSKILQLVGMLIIGISFMRNFPNSINWNSFIVGVSFFSMGFMIEKFVLK